LAEHLSRYYTRYYRDTLGIPEWQRLVARRLQEEELDTERVSRIQRLIGRRFDGMRVLNVGCGTGGFNVAAEQAGADTFGIDTNPDAVTICRLRAIDGGGGRYARAQAEALPFRDNVFELVYCVSTLEHVADVGLTLREMVRVLRPGGTLFLYSPSGWALYESHYKLPWLPGCPRPLARLYLRALGRPTAFVETLNRLTKRCCWRLLEAAGAVVEPFPVDIDLGSGRGPKARVARAYYRVLKVEPYIALLARKRP